VSRRISIIIVPESGQSRRYKIPIYWIKIGIGVCALLLVVVVLSVLAYARLISKALDRDHLIAENERLRAENRRIVTLAEEVEQSRKSLERIIRSFGGKIDMKQPGGDETR